QFRVGLLLQRLQVGGQLRQDLVEVLGRQVEVTQLLADRLDALDQLLLATRQVAQHLGNAPVEASVLALDDEVLLLGRPQSLDDVIGPLAGVLDTEVALVIALDLAPAHSGRGVLLRVLALLLADGAALVADLLLPLLPLVAAPAVDRLVPDNQPVSPRAAPAGPRGPADIDGRRVSVARFRRGGRRGSGARPLSDPGPPGCV